MGLKARAALAGPRVFLSSCRAPRPASGEPTPNLDRVTARGPRISTDPLAHGGRLAVRLRRRDALNCIRCGACLTSPVYDRAAGHAYVGLPGPIGATSPQLPHRATRPCVRPSRAAPARRLPVNITSGDPGSPAARHTDAYAANTEPPSLRRRRVRVACDSYRSVVGRAAGGRPALLAASAG